jgi:RNA-binding protein YhbY
MKSGSNWVVKMVPLERGDQYGSNGVRIVIIRQVLNQISGREKMKHKIYSVCREKKQHVMDVHCII